MFEYVIIFLVLFIFSILVYLLYEKFVKKDNKQNAAIYVEALKNLLDGRHESAFAKLRQVVAEDSSNIDAYLRLGKILRDNNKSDRAVQVHKDLTLRDDLSIKDKVKILQELCLDYFALNDTDMSLAALKEIVSLKSDHRWAHIQLLKLLEKNKKWEEAYDTAAKLLKMEANKSKKPLANYKFQLGQELHDKREFHKARIVYKEAIGLNPTFVPAYLAVGDSYYEEKRFEDAVNFWNKLIKTVPEQGHQVIERLKRTLFDLGRFGDIVDICHNILEHFPKNFEAKFTLAEFYEKKGELDTSEKILVELAEDYPNNLNVTFELIRLYLEKNDTRKIREHLKIIERKKENRPDKIVVDTNLINAD